MKNTTTISAHHISQFLGGGMLVVSALSSTQPIWSIPAVENTVIGIGVLLIATSAGDVLLLALCPNFRKNRSGSDR